MAHTSDRDVAYWTSSRLSGEWSSLDSFGARLTPQMVEALVAQFPRLDPMIRVRLLLSTLFVPQERLQDLKPALQQLAEVAVAEDDDWVRVFGNAVRNFDGRLDVAEVERGFPLVESTLRQLQEEMLKSEDSTGYRPLEESYLSQRLQRMRGIRQESKPQSHGHFTLREGAGLSISQMFDGQQPAADGKGVSAAAGLGVGLGRIGSSAGMEPEADMFMDSKASKAGETIAGLGTIGRVDSRRTTGRIKQLDVSEAIAAQELSRQMSIQTAEPKVIRAKRGSMTDDEGGPSLSATPTVATGAHNYFGPADGLGLGGAVLSMPSSAAPGGPGKRERDWEDAAGVGGDLLANDVRRESSPPRLNDTLAGLEAEDEELQPASGGGPAALGNPENQTNYF